MSIPDDDFSDPEKIFRKILPDQYDEEGNLLSALDRAKNLTAESTPETIESIIRVCSNDDPLSIDFVLTTIKEKTNNRFSIGTLRQLVKKIQKQSVVKFEGPSWTKLIATDQNGFPEGTTTNVLTALREADELKNIFAFDEFHQTPMIMGKPPWANGSWKGSRRFNDADDARVLVWIQQQGITRAKIDVVRQALSIIMDDNPFHPVRDYLESLVWDRIPRVDGWLTYYLGVEPIDNYTIPVGTCWLISAVARIFNPGCMAKYCLILEGEQDLKKSSALETLGYPWFTDDISELGTKDSSMQVGNAWIIELSELDSVRKAHISAIKAFISRKVDRFRKPFGRFVIEQERQCVLAGTINPSGDYLADDTGAVRFWPVTCTAIDLDTLKQDRDQLWAEAVHRYRSGEAWWLFDQYAITAARTEQAARQETDLWEARIGQWLYETLCKEITVDRIAEELLEIPKKEQNRAVATRIGSIMRGKLHWRKGRESKGERRWFYYQPDGWTWPPKPALPSEN